MLDDEMEALEGMDSYDGDNDGPSDSGKADSVTQTTAGKWRRKTKRQIPRTYSSF